MPTVKKAVWPISIGSVTAQSLRELDDIQFGELRQRLQSRTVRRTNSSRYAKSLSRRLEIKRRKHKTVRFTKEALLSKPKACEVMDALVPERHERWRKQSIVRRRPCPPIAARQFSFLDDPKGTVNLLKRITVAECEYADIRINFLDEYMLDIGPYMVLGFMRQNMAPLSAGGIVSNATVKVLDAVGLRQFLRMRWIGPVGYEDVWPLQFRRRRSGTTGSGDIAFEPSTAEITADRITDQMDAWLGELPEAQELTRSGAGLIKTFITEILNNAERHSRPSGDGEWMYAGFMARRGVDNERPDERVHICHLSFFSPGRPIHESIKDAPADIREQLDDFTAVHRSSDLTRETLWTVLSCQDGISRVKQGPDDPSGGTGLMSIVQFVSEVGHTPLKNLQPSVAILSGRSYIRFRPPYAVGLTSDDDDRRLQWFNPENDAKTPPDPEHVMDLPLELPGTLISMRFTIDDALVIGGHDDGESDAHDRF